MKVGILEAGAPPPPLDQSFGRYDAMVSDLLGASFSYASYDVPTGRLPQSPQEQDAWIVTGSPAGVYDELPWIERLEDFLRAARGKARLIGICFGHQIMAEAFGGRVERSQRGWGIGLHRYEVHEAAPWMDAVPSFAVPVSHQDQIVALPPSATVLAGSPFNPFGLIAYQDQPAISLQCHPEFSPAYARALIEFRRERLNGADEAIASLDAPNDRAVVGAWLRRFLEA